MDTAFMRKTFALIAKGLIEKEQLLQTEPTRYPYSKGDQHVFGRKSMGGEPSRCRVS